MLRAGAGLFTYWFVFSDGCDPLASVIVRGRGGHSLSFRNLVGFSGGPRHWPQRGAEPGSLGGIPAPWPYAEKAGLRSFLPRFKGSCGGLGRAPVRALSEGEVRRDGGPGVESRAQAASQPWPGGRTSRDSREVTKQNQKGLLCRKGEWDRPRSQPGGFHAKRRPIGPDPNARGRRGSSSDTRKLKSEVPATESRGEVAGGQSAASPRLPRVSPECCR